MVLVGLSVEAFLKNPASARTFPVHALRYSSHPNTICQIVNPARKLSFSFPAMMMMMSQWPTKRFPTMLRSCVAVTITGRCPEA